MTFAREILPAARANARAISSAARAARANARAIPPAARAERHLARGIAPPVRAILSAARANGTIARSKTVRARANVSVGRATRRTSLATIVPVRAVPSPAGHPQSPRQGGITRPAPSRQNVELIRTSRSQSAPTTGESERANDNHGRPSKTYDQGRSRCSIGFRNTLALCLWRGIAHAVQSSETPRTRAYRAADNKYDQPDSHQKRSRQRRLVVLRALRQLRHLSHSTRSPHPARHTNVVPRSVDSP